MFIGIDLGTSNSCVAIANRGDKEARIFPVQQYVSRHELESKETLPSALFLLPESEFEVFEQESPSGEKPFLFGAHSRELGLLAPDRYLHSSKSWLAVKGISPRQRILPFQSQATEQRFSPLEISTGVLKRIALELEKRLGSFSAEDLVTVTIPASFDESARNLTAEAITAAGFQNFRLLEEPTAAFYSWLSEHRGKLKDTLSGGERVLVCDLGGGTCDFSLIEVQENERGVALERIKVGPHILLGGDNMDLALAYRAKQKLEEQGKQVDHWQFLSLVQQARLAKEVLLSEKAPEAFELSVASRGASLFASSVSTELTKADIDEIVIEGFLPLVDLPTRPEKAEATLEELGLPYASDARITAHLAAFLAGGSEVALKPSHIFFNGGVSKGEGIRNRILEQLRSWYSEEISVLENSEPDTSVAKGAAFSAALLDSEDSLRIRSGLSRSLYIGIKESRMAIPGAPAELSALCIAEKGLEEAASQTLSGKQFQVQSGQKLTFQLFESTERENDKLGSKLPSTRDLELVGTVEAEFKNQGEEAERIQVELQSSLSEIGLLELLLQSCNDERSWKLEFSLRGGSESS